MKFMIEFRVMPGHKAQVLENFEKTGPNRHPGVTFRGAWIGTREDIIFVLAESDDEAKIAAVAQSWIAHGDIALHTVIDVEQY